MGTRKIQELPTLIMAALVAFANDDVANRRRAGTCLHEDFPDDDTDLVEAAVATNTATAVTRINELKAKYNAHIAKTAAHKAADAANAASSADATDLASGITLANELQGDFNTHHDAATYHHLGGAGGHAVPANDATTVASDEATLVTLTNALVDAYHRHVSSGAPTIELIAS